MTDLITVVGAGAIGCAVAAAWSSAGCKVALVTRPGRVEGFRGARDVLFGTGRVQLQHELVTDSPDYSQAALVVVATKATAIDGLVQTLETVPEQVPILSLMNGPRSAAALAQRLRRPVCAGMVPWNAAWVGEGLVVSGAGQITVDQRLPVQLPSDGLAPVITSDAIEGVLWGKLLLNLINPVNAISGMPVKAMLKDRRFRLRYRDAYVEALQVMRGAAIKPAKVSPLAPPLIPHVLALPDTIFQTVFLPLQKLKDDATTSMAQDIAAGRATEIAWINGAIVDLAREIGADAPVNAALVKEIEAISPH